MKRRLLETTFYKEVFNDFPNLLDDTSEFVMKIRLSVSCSHYRKYVESVTLSLIELEYLFNQLEQAVVMLTEVCITKKLKENDITKLDGFKYNLENYLIRLIAIDDRILYLIDKVYLLGNPDKNCKEYIIMKNEVFNDDKIIRVKYNKLKDLLVKYRKVRNSIIHQKSYVDDELIIYNLQQEMIMNEELHTSFETDIGKFQKYFKKNSKEYMLDTEEKFKSINEELFILICEILYELNARYLIEKNRFLDEIKNTDDSIFFS
ncbi:MAG: Cthe_2314 family HEPN domain-containing protein [Firmicutes bacterium]|nr:Cthe_2314 family HEPN domain-containing protein [Bacillota bacterium]